MQARAQAIDQRHAASSTATVRLIPSRRHDGCCSAALRGFLGLDEWDSHCRLYSYVP